MTGHATHWHDRGSPHTRDTPSNARPNAGPDNGSDGEQDIAPGGRVALESWLQELERLARVLEAQSSYLDAVELGEDVSPPEPFVGTRGLPRLPVALGPYARDLVARNEEITRRSMALSAQLRPRLQRPIHVPSGSARGSLFEQRA